MRSAKGLIDEVGLNQKKYIDWANSGYNSPRKCAISSYYYRKNVSKSRNLYLEYNELMRRHKDGIIESET